MDRWWIYIKERFPLTTHILIASGISCSGFVVNRGYIQLDAFLLSLIGLLLIFGYSRLKDDFDDAEKDKIAFPERPIPRGLLRIRDVRQVLNVYWFILVSYFLVIWMSLNLTAAVVYLLCVIFLWLKDKEFYSKELLTKWPIFRTTIQQEIVILLVFFAVACGRPRAVISMSSISYALTVFGAFYTYDICRKLDPYAHPIRMSPVLVYGFRKIFWGVIVLAMISALGAYGLGVQRFLLPFEVSVVVMLTLLFIRPQHYQIPEFIAAISLVVHVWSGVIFYF